MKHTGQYSSAMAKETHILGEIDAELEDSIFNLEKEEDDVDAEMERVELLKEMFGEEKNKLDTIRGSINSHENKLTSKQSGVDELYKKIEGLQKEKADELKKIEANAEVEAQKALSYANRVRSQHNSGSSQNTNILAPIAPISKQTSNTGQDVIDKSKYNIFPLKKIRNMKKIVNMWVRAYLNLAFSVRSLISPLSATNRRTRQMVDRATKG